MRLNDVLLPQPAAPQKPTFMPGSMTNESARRIFLSGTAKSTSTNSRRPPTAAQRGASPGCGSMRPRESSSSFTRSIGSITLMRRGRHSMMMRRWSETWLTATVNWIATPIVSSPVSTPSPPWYIACMRFAMKMRKSGQPKQMALHAFANSSICAR